MFNSNTSMQFHNKSLKTFIEYTFYSTIAKAGLINTHPLIVPGPALYRTHRIAASTKVLGSNGTTYVELNPTIYNSLQPIIETKSLPGNYPFQLLNRNILDCQIRQVIDFDATGNINQIDGNVFFQLLHRQASTFPNQLKSIIYTAALRPTSLAATLQTYSTIIKSVIGADITFTSKSPTDAPSHRTNRWKAQCVDQVITSRLARISAGIQRQTTRPPVSVAYCNEVYSETSSSVQTLQTFTYNSGGGNMITFNLIYK